MFDTKKRFEIDLLAINGSNSIDVNYWIDFKKRFPKVTIMEANIDVNRGIFIGTPAAFERIVRENIINLAHGGRYMVSPICELPFNLPLPNVLAIPKVIEKYGNFPIKF